MRPTYTLSFRRKNQPQYDFDINKTQNEYDMCSSDIQTYLADLERIILDTNEPLQGNSFYIDKTLELLPQLKAKQVNLFWYGKQATAKICEIGFNAGHSTILMLLGRDKTPLDFTIFDIGTHRYTVPCLEYIETKFPHVNFEYIEGDSTVKVAEWINENNTQANTYDLVHVDGGHSEHCILNDMKNADMLVKLNGIIIIDDTNDITINKYVDMYLNSGNYTELNGKITTYYPHRIIRKLNHTTF